MTMENKTPIAIGIDLGTTNSVVAFSVNGKPTLIPTATGSPLLPSVVSYAQDIPLVGQEALILLEQNPKLAPLVIRSVKRLLRTLTEPALQVTDSSGRLLSPIDVSAEILKHLKKQAEDALGQEISQAVITVPAYFDEPARAATKEAARLAGLEVLRLISEPTAAALAYGLESAKEGLYAVYDLGGGTFDFSLLKMRSGVFQVIATGGDTALGGDDIDQAIVDYWVSHFQTSAPLSHLLLLARKAKETLSSSEGKVWKETGEEHPSLLSLSQETLEELSLPLIQRTFLLCKEALKAVSLKINDLKGVIFVGGATRMPFLQKQGALFFEKQPLVDLNPEEVVALGAALQAESLTFGNGTLLLDVTPLSLGIEVMGELVEKVISRNSPIPLAKTEEFTTHQDGQTALKIHILQGEGLVVQQCLSLGEFILKGIPPLKAGIARVHVTFAIDADGLLMVSAREKTTGIHQQIEVNANRSLQEAESLLQEDSKSSS